MPTKAEIIHMLVKWLEQAHLRDGALLSVWMFLTAVANKRGGHLEWDVAHKPNTPVEANFHTRPMLAAS